MKLHSIHLVSNPKGWLEDGGKLTTNQDLELALPFTSLALLSASILSLGITTCESWWEPDGGSLAAKCPEAAGIFSPDNLDGS